jgi:hypothetical protein
MEFWGDGEEIWGQVATWAMANRSTSQMLDDTFWFVNLSLSTRSGFFLAFYAQYNRLLVH